MLKRFLAIVISTILVSLGLSIMSYVPQEQRDLDVFYFSIGESFLFVAYVFFIFYFVVGLTFSWLIDNYRKRFREKSALVQYFIGVALYSLTGLLLGTAYHFISGPSQFNLYTFTQTLGIWFVASFIYFHALWILEKDFLRKKRT